VRPDFKRLAKKRGVSQDRKKPAHCWQFGDGRRPGLSREFLEFSGPMGPPSKTKEFEARK